MRSAPIPVTNPWVADLEVKQLKHAADSAAALVPGHGLEVFWSGEVAVRSRKEWLLKLVESAQGQYTTHASTEMERLDLYWEDVLEAVRTADTVGKSRDAMVGHGHVYDVTGRDTRGRTVYLAGKEIKKNDQRQWLVITFHEADPE